MPYTYPTATEFKTIEPVLVRRGAEGRVGLEIMPIERSNVFKIRWTQKDNYYGLQQLRGMDGAPSRISRVGEKTYEYEPGVFGEYGEITETELLNRAGSADVLTTPISIDDLIAEFDTDLIGREWDRIESSIWTLLTTGTISIKLAGPNGSQVGWKETFPIQTYTSLNPWDDPATGTPLADLQEISLSGLGKGVSFGAGATMYMSSRTAQTILQNRNEADLWGLRIQGGNTTGVSINQATSIFTAQGLPALRIYDEGTIETQGGDLVPYIPDGKIVLIGRRPQGGTVGAYRVVRNIHAGYQPQSYRFVKDYAQGINAEKRVPGTVEVHRGHNGGPLIYYPGSVLVMTVFVP